MHTTSVSANRLGDRGDLNLFIQFSCSPDDLSGKRLAETKTTALMQRGWP